MVCRKNFLNLEPEQKERFIDAVRRLKSSGAESNEYDRYVDIHRDHFFGGMAHGGLGVSSVAQGVPESVRERSAGDRSGRDAPVLGLD